VKLTHCEYNLLEFFLRNVDRVVARDELLSLVWGYEAHTNSRTVDSHVVQLRRKLERDPSAPIHLVTIHGRGYRFLTSPKPKGAQLTSTRQRPETAARPGLFVLRGQ